MTEFVHLHVHTQFSLLDGAVKVKDLVKRTKRAVAVTDHNAMFGILSFYKEATAKGIQPILGCEIGHLPLLAATAEGYKNLMWLASHATALPPLEEPGDHTQADYLLGKLEGRTKGLIGLTGCMGSPLSQRILYEGEHQGSLFLGQLRERFEPGSLYVELQDHGLPEQPVLNGILHDLSIHHGLRKVATNDVHYPERGDADAHLVLGCIKNQRQLVAARAGHHGSSEMYLKSADEMAALFTASTLATTLEIAERCSGLKLDLNKPMLPTFAVPDGYTVDSYFRHLVWEGLRRRSEEGALQGGLGDSNKQRVTFEMDVISKMNFPGYFLIVWDFIRFAKENGIPVGPGRGSGAGSLVAYSLRITDIDPIRHGLLFERFLNPDRVSMPDFDIDFCMVRRDEVVAYVRQKYGVESVGQIVTCMELKARSVLKDVGRALGMTPMDAQKIANMVPPGSQTHTFSIAEAVVADQRLGAPEYREVVGYAQKLEGLTRHVGVHAAGIVISEGPLWDHVPVFQDDHGHYVTQYAMNEVEAAGLVKFDFLGLKTLTVLEIARRLLGPRSGAPEPWRQAYETCGGVLPPQAWEEAYRACGGGVVHGVNAEGLLDLNQLPLDDPKVYALLATGETKGVFQLESSGMQQLFRDMKTDNFGDIVAGVALFRPGPLGSGMCKSYVDRKNKREPVRSFHPLVDEHLQDTYGVVVYQEQVMQVARSLAGYTLARADLLRRAMGKKKPAEMAKERVGFVEGAATNGVDAQEANRIFDLLDFFSGYGFNRCVVGGTRIVDALTGERTTVEELFENRRKFRIHALTESGKLQARKVERVMQNGRKLVFELRTANGNRIVATGNHPFRTLNGWTNLEDLHPGDRIAAPRTMPTAARKSWPKHELVTLAWLLTEGNTCHPTCLYFFNNNRDVIDDFFRSAEKFPHSKARSYARGTGRFEVCVSTGRDARFKVGKRLPSVGPKRSGMFDWAGSLGILGKKATQKSIPEPVFLLRDEQLEIFMGRMWSGDGFISNHNHFVPFYATSSAEMASDVQQMLLRLGILSRIYTKSFRYKYKGKVRMMPGYTVPLIGGVSTRVFLDRVTPHCVGRDDQIDRLRKHLKKTEDNTCVDTIPIGVRDWIREARVERGVGWDEIKRGARVSTSEMSRSVSFAPRQWVKKQGFRRDVVWSVGQFLGSKPLMDVASSDVFWDRVVAIEPRGEEETYDLTVETDHNFVADGLFVHNSHSAGYALLSYQTAYLKTHYPAEFLCALLTCDQSQSERVVRTLADALTMGIQVLPPDINRSDLSFKVEDGGIRFGLGAVKGLGEAALAGVLEGRPFKDLFDFTSRVDVKKGVLDTLIQCGALDSMGVERAQAFATVELALKRAKPIAKDAKLGQTNWFSEASFEGTQSYVDAPGWDQREKLAREYKALGFYVSGHPMDRYANAQRVLDRLQVIPIARCEELADRTMVRLIGMVEDYRVKEEWKISFFMFGDRSGYVGAKLRDYEAFGAVLTSGEPVLIYGQLKQDENEEGEVKTTLLVKDVRLLADAIKLEARAVIVTVRAPATLKPLQDMLEKVKGSVPVGLRLVLETGVETLMSLPQRVEVGEAFLAGVERVVGGGAVEIR